MRCAGWRLRIDMAKIEPYVAANAALAPPHHAVHGSTSAAAACDELGEAPNARASRSSYRGIKHRRALSAASSRAAAHRLSIEASSGGERRHPSPASSAHSVRLVRRR